MRYSINRLTKEEYQTIKDLFRSDLSAGKVAEQFDLEISVVTSLFKKEYPKEDVDARRKKHSKKKTSKQTTTICQICNQTFSTTVSALSQMKRFKQVLCPKCKSKRDYKSQEQIFCPVCNLRVRDVKGLTNHIKRMAFKKNDQAHLDYFNQEESKKWEDKRINIDYVECQICKREGKHFSEYRMTTLRRHLPSVHKISISDYTSKYNSPTIAIKTEEKRIESIQKDSASRPPDFYDKTKTGICERCQKSFEISLYQSSTQHFLLCSQCKKVIAKEEYLAEWKDKKEGIDYVECKVPGCTTKSGFPFRTKNNLKDHLRFNHNLTTEDYESLYHSKHYIERKLPNCAIIDHRLEEVKQRRADQQILCEEANFCIICQEQKDPNFLLGNICYDCISREEDKDGNLYCKLSDCNFKSQFLATHITKTHKMSTIDYCKMFPGSYFVSSKIRKKQKKSGGWSKGLTKETDPRIEKTSKGRQGQTSWCKGLTKFDDLRIYKRTQKIIETKSDPNWVGPPSKLITLNLEDFKPYLDEKGDVFVPKAIKGLNLCCPIIRREMEHLGLKPKRYLVTQHQILELISKITGQPYKEEKSFNEIRNPETGRKFLYDGYLQTLNLIVEYHGYHHFVFPNHIHKNIIHFKEAQKRDYLKRELAINGDYFFLVVRYDAMSPK